MEGFTYLQTLLKIKVVQIVFKLLKDDIAFKIIQN